MPGARRRAASPTPDGAGWRVLRDLVIEVLQVLPAQPAYSIPADGRHAMAADATVAALPPLAGRSREDVTSPPPNPPRHAVDDTHAEIWELVTRAQQGDGEAFGELYDRYFDTVFRFIYYRVNDRATAEDFTSETFLRALRRIRGITYQGRDIGAWFVTIARNIVLDHVKSARYRLEVTTPDSIDQHDNGPGPEASVISSLTTEHLMRAVHKLGDDQRDCILLRFIQGLSVSETAQVMGRNDGAIKALQHRAVKKLAELVRGELR